MNLPTREQDELIKAGLEKAMTELQISMEALQTATRSMRSKHILLDKVENFQSILDALRENYTKLRQELNNLSSRVL